MQADKSLLVYMWRCRESGMPREHRSAAPLPTYLALCISSIWLSLSYIWTPTLHYSRINPPQISHSSMLLGRGKFPSPRQFWQASLEKSPAGKLLPLRDPGTSAKAGRK